MNASGGVCLTGVGHGGAVPRIPTASVASSPLRNPADSSGTRDSFSSCPLQRAITLAGASRRLDPR
jgi:hypothetical protein